MIFGINFQKKVYFRLKSWKNDHENWILHIQISLSTNFHIKLTIAIFGPNLPTKGSYFQSKTDKIDTTIEFCIFELVLVPNLCLNWQFWFFWPDLPKECFSGLKQKKWTPLIFNIILHIQICLVRNFSSNWQFWFFGPNLPKKSISSQKLKKWTSSLNSAYSNYSSAKFQLKLIILRFWTKITKFTKRVFPVENRTSSPRTTNLYFLCSKR